MAREDHLQTHSEPSLITIDARLIVPTTGVATLAPLPPKNMEWRPVIRNREREEVRDVRNKRIELTKNTDAARYVALKGKDILGSSSGKEVPPTMIPPTQAREDSSELQRGSKNHVGSLGQNPPKELGGERTDLIK